MKGVVGTFAIWEDLKAYAARYARTGKPLPVRAQCERWLQNILDKHHAGQLPRAAFSFYTNELCMMIHELRSKRSPR